MWLLLALLAALFQVLRNTAMKRLGHALDEYINVWGRFTCLLPFALVFALVGGWPEIKPGFMTWCLAFGACQTLSTLALAKALKLSPISIVTALWKVSLLFLLVMVCLGWMHVAIRRMERERRGVAPAEISILAARPTELEAGATP